MITTENKEKFHRPLIEKKADAQLSACYESSSGFRDSFSQMIGAAPTKPGYSKILKASWLDTPLGPMIAIADEQALYLLEFVDRRTLERNVERLGKNLKSTITLGHTQPLGSIESELAQYYNGKLREFKTPLFVQGSPFQQLVWEELKKIPPGETRSYLDVAFAVGKPSAVRAVAQACGANQIAVVIPCHRVINTNGGLGGYAGGLTRKNWLIDHEKKRDLMP